MLRMPCLCPIGCNKLCQEGYIIISHSFRLKGSSESAQKSHYNCPASMLAALHVHLAVVLSLRLCHRTYFCLTSCTVSCMPTTRACFHQCAADVPSLFQSALYCSGALYFPFPDVLYQCQKRQDNDLKYLLTPVSHLGAVAFSSTTHAVLLKNFPAVSETV